MFTITSTVEMLLCCLLALAALTPPASSTNPGVKARLTAKGLEYGKGRSAGSLLQLEKQKPLQASVVTFFLCVLLGRQIGMASILRKLQTIKLPDISGKESVSPIGKVEYRLTK